MNREEEAIIDSSVRNLSDTLKYMFGEIVKDKGRAGHVTALEYVGVTGYGLGVLFKENKELKKEISLLKKQMVAMQNLIADNINKE